VTASPTVPGADAPKGPKPETRQAVLVSAGFRKPTATTHFYTTTRLVSLKGPGGGPAWAHMFVCLRTGVERIWGVEKTSVDVELEAIDAEVAAATDGTTPDPDAGRN